MLIRFMLLETCKCISFILCSFFITCLFLLFGAFFILGHLISEPRGTITESFSSLIHATCSMQMDIFCSLYFFDLLHILCYWSVFYFGTPRGTFTEFLAHSSYLKHANGYLLFSVFFYYLLIYAIWSIFILGQPGAPLLNSYPIHVNWNMQLDIFYSLHFLITCLFLLFGTLFFFFGSPHQWAPGHHYWIILPSMLLIKCKWKSFVLCIFFICCIFLVISVFLFGSPWSTLTEFISHSCYLKHSNGYLLFSAFFLLLAYFCYLEHFLFWVTPSVSPGAPIQNFYPAYVTFAT